MVRNDGHLVCLRDGVNVCVTFRVLLIPLLLLKVYQDCAVNVSLPMCFFETPGQTVAFEACYRRCIKICRCVYALELLFVIFR